MSRRQTFHSLFLSLPSLPPFLSFSEIIVAHERPSLLTHSTLLSVRITDSTAQHPFRSNEEITLHHQRIILCSVLFYSIPCSPSYYTVYTVYTVYLLFIPPFYTIFQQSDNRVEKLSNFLAHFSFKFYASNLNDI